MLPYVLVGGVALAAYLQHRRAYRTTPPSFEGPSTRLNRTTVVPHLGCPFPEDQNAIWCITLDLAWKKAMDEVFQGPIRLLEQPPEAELLNLTRASWRDLPQELLETALSVKETQEADIYRLFASLQISLDFERPFYQLKEPLHFNRYAPVRGFGVAPGTSAARKLLDQVRVLYDEGNEFILDPCQTSSPFQLILANLPRADSLQETITNAEARCQKYRAHSFGSGCSLMIPEQSWDLHHDFSQLKGKLDRPPFGGELEVQQRVRFRLDRYATFFSRRPAGRLYEKQSH